MKERPIVFSTLMIKAILDGTKTMTRRVVKKDIVNQNVYPCCNAGDMLWVRESWYYEEHMHDLTAGEPDIPGGRYSHRLVYRADYPEYPVNVGVGKQGWRPSIFMPRWASRITLEVTGIKAERLQDITEEDAKKEGVPYKEEPPIDPIYCPQCGGTGLIGAFHPVSLGYMEIDCPYCDTARKQFSNLWDAINGRKDGKTWKDNPWVWAITFKVVKA